MAEDLRTLLDRPVEDPGLVFVELMFASLEADPDNRDGYLFLLDLLRGRTSGKPRLQRVLRDMAARFPDDSTPWLELATLHYSRNAYRQATPHRRWPIPCGACCPTGCLAPASARRTVVWIINEPTAAALSYESGAEGSRTLLVYDLGGGTFDVSVVRVEQGVVEVLATAGDNQLGGEDFDALVLERLNAHVETSLGVEDAREDRLLQARLRRASERAKIELSDQPYVRVEEDHVATVNGEARHLECELARADFERDLEPFIDRSLRAVTTALQDAGVRLSQLDRVLLVGGSTRIPRIAAVLTERLGQEPHGEVDPDLCVALGAGVQAGIEMGQDTQAVLVDITPYTFGTRAEGELYGRPYAHQFIPLIRRNSKLPATRTEVFFTLFEDQEEVEIKVFQGEDPDALKNVEIGTFMFGGLNEHEDAHEQGLLVTYRLDLDGLLHVHARERATGRELRGVVENAIGRSSDEVLGTARERVSALWGEADDGAEAGAQDAGAATAGGGAAPSPAPVALPPEGAGVVVAPLARAAPALEAAPAEDREEMINLMEDLRDALREGASERAAELRRELDEILFYLE
ncbi:MAG: Hsp70 family protein [Acidobacteria bacterium]|nr:Hsp70 family protein [Acidobacteriota bacterium]